VRCESVAHVVAQIRTNGEHSSDHAEHDERDEDARDRSPPSGARGIREPPLFARNHRLIMTMPT
jgi:hypothetical protein